MDSTVFENSNSLIQHEVYKLYRIIERNTLASSPGSPSLYHCHVTMPKKLQVRFRTPIGLDVSKTYSKIAQGIVLLGCER